MAVQQFLYQSKINDIEYRDRSDNAARLWHVPHLHRDLELVVLLEGEVTVYTDSKKSRLIAGDIFLAFPNQIHYYEGHGEKQRYHLLIVKPDIMPDLMDDFTSSVPESPVLRGEANDPVLRVLYERLFRYCGEAADRPYLQTLQRGYLLAFFSELLSRMKLSRIVTGDAGSLRTIVTFCTQHYGEDLSLALLEERLHLNKYYISHLFSKRLGLRFNDYINSLRVSEACRYLAVTDLGITEISERVGFNTLRTFNRAFMKLHGVSPSEYRKSATR